MDGRGVTLRTFLSRWRWRLFGAGVGTAAVALGIGCAWPLASGRTDPPLFGKLNTQSALNEARRSGGDAGSDTQTPSENRLLRMQAVFAFVEDHRLRAVHHLA